MIGQIRNNDECVILSEGMKNVVDDVCAMLEGAK